MRDWDRLLIAEPPKLTDHSSVVSDEEDFGTVYPLSPSEVGPWLREGFFT